MKRKPRKVQNLGVFLDFKNHITNDEIFTAILGNFLIGSSGTVFNLKTKTHLRPNPDQTGRMTYKINVNNEDYHHIKRYRLVALFYCDKPSGIGDLDLLFNENYIVHHIDGNKLNDMWYNLCWMRHNDHSSMERLLSCGRLKRSDIDSSDKIYQLFPMRLSTNSHNTCFDYSSLSRYDLPLIRSKYFDYCDEHCLSYFKHDSLQTFKSDNFYQKWYELIG